MPEESEKTAETLASLASSSQLAEALESDRFKQFLDYVPVAILVSEFADTQEERVVYLNREASEILGISSESIERKSWSRIDELVDCGDAARFSEALFNEGGEPITLRIALGGDGGFRNVEIQSAIATDDSEDVNYRLVALIEVMERGADADRDEAEARLRDKDMQLRELQHRVKNNLQIVTALIRMEARRAGPDIGAGAFERLAGRIEALGLLYTQLALDDGAGVVELGGFVSQIAGSVVRAQAKDGVRLDMQIEPCPTTIEIAMPVGLLVNELMTNAMKYAFEGRDEGVVTVRCLKDGSDDMYSVTVADDGVGMAAGAGWPQPGKLGALMVRSFKESAEGRIDMVSTPGEGVSTTIRFALPPQAS